MVYQSFLIKYAEIGTKGKNRYLFEDALIKQIHPDYTPDETIALLKKQAGYTYDRLAAPTDGKEYRGAGLVNALAAVLTDQPKPTLGAIEYSRDGSPDWKPLAVQTVVGLVGVAIGVVAYTRRDLPS